MQEATPNLTWREEAPLFLNIQNLKCDRSPDVVRVVDEWSGGFFVFFFWGVGGIKCVRLVKVP